MIRFWKPITLGIVAAGTAVAITTAASASSAPPKLASQMTAVTLADGLVFNHGPAAQYLAGMPRPTVTLDAKMTRVRRLIDNTLMTHSSQADRFALQVQSGDRVRVLHALQWLGGITRAAMNAVYGTAATDRAITQANEMISKAASARPAPGSGVTDVQRVPIYYYLEVVVAVTVATVVTAVAFVIERPDSPGGLATEQFVNFVANRLQNVSTKWVRVAELPTSVRKPLDTRSSEAGPDADAASPQRWVTRGVAGNTLNSAKPVPGPPSARGKGRNDHRAYWPA